LNEVSCLFHNKDEERLAPVELLCQTVNSDGKIAKELVIEYKTAIEQMRLIQQLDEEDKQTIFRLIEKMLTNKKFKDFFQKNVAAL
jgi:hypothetical protein